MDATGDLSYSLGENHFWSAGTFRRRLILRYSIYLVGASVLLITSIPACLAAGAGLPGFLVGTIIIGIGLGGVKACMSPFMGESRLIRCWRSVWLTTKPLADQYTNFKDKIRFRKSGQRVLIVRDLSIEKIYHMYYW